MSIWQPQPGPQSLAIAAPFVPEMMFGGARGGGKSDFLLGDFMQDIEQGANWRGIMFRKTFPELEELIQRGIEIFSPLGAEWKEGKQTFRFPSGAFLRMRFLEMERDAARYQGHQYTWIGWDELTNWASANAYNKLKACLRSATGAVNKRIRSSANPGGIGHHWVKEYFVDEAPMGLKLIGPKRNRMFIPSKLQDNRLLVDNDPDYIENLRELGSEELVKMWLDGNWDVITGAFFPEFDKKRHVLDPFPIPHHWMKFRSMDWGSAKPFSVDWWAVVGEYTEVKTRGNIIGLHPGALVLYRSWYGKGAKSNVGLRLTAKQVGKGIREREVGDHITYGVIDPSAYKQDGGPSNAETMAREQIVFRRADNSRKAGWDQVRDRLVGDGDTGPMIYFFSTCTDMIRTIPALPMDENDPEDADSAAEDHAPDSLRYACMSRPFSKAAPRKPEPAKTLQNATYQDLWDSDDIEQDRYVQV